MNKTPKICTKCGKTKPATSEYFHRNRYTSDELNKVCKACLRLAAKTHRIDKDKRRTTNQHRRAWKAGAEGNHTMKEARAVFEQQGSCCAYCSIQLEWGDHTEDHIIPLADGGTHDISNIAIACSSCNSSKCAKDLTKWLEFKFGKTKAATILSRIKNRKPIVAILLIEQSRTPPAGWPTFFY